MNLTVRLKIEVIHQKYITKQSFKIKVSKILCNVQHLFIPNSLCFIRQTVFLNLYLHQQLKLDNSLYIIHTKWFVLLTEFLGGCHLEMWRIALQCQNPTRSFLLFLSRVETGTTTHTRHIQDGGTQKIQWSLKKSLGAIIYTELSNLSCWCRHKLRKTLIWDECCWTAEVPFK